MRFPGGHEEALPTDRADCGKHRKAEMLSRAAGRDAPNDVGAPSDGVFGIGRRLAVLMSAAARNHQDEAGGFRTCFPVKPWKMTRVWLPIRRCGSVAA